MPTQPNQSPVPAFMDQLMARIDPHQPQPGEALRNAQLICGRWITSRRLRLGLKSEQLAGMVDVEVGVMRLLEIGLADASFVSEASRQRLVKRLAPSREDLAWVADIVAIALGSHEALDRPVMDRVVADLEAIESGITRRDLALTAELVDESTDAPPPVTLEPGMFDVLRVLSEGENYTYGIWEKVHEQSRQLAVAEIGVLLLRMIGKNLIEKIGQRYDPALDDEPLQYYRITATGRQAFHAERTRQAREERERREEEAMIKGRVKPAPQS